MLYRFSYLQENISEKILISDETAIIFLYEYFAIAQITELTLTGVFNNSEFIATVFNSINIKTDLAENSIHLSRKISDHPNTLIIDHANHARIVFPFALACAINAIQADIKGLETIKNSIPVFQRELYRFNINTDFCDYSKLKIYNNKVIRPKSKPVNVAEDDSMSLYFIPLAVKFGKVEIELKDGFFEKFTWLTPLLSPLKLSMEKL